MRYLLLLAVVLALLPVSVSAESCPLFVNDNPGRYELHHGCLTVTGTVDGIQILEADGEWHTFVLLDPGWATTFAPGAVGRVLIDTEMLHQTMATAPILGNGQRVSVTGALVYDRLRGYGRIRPVYWIE